MSKLRMSKIIFDLGFRIKFQLHWAVLLIVDIDGATLHLHYVKDCVKNVEFNYSYVTSKITP